MFFEPITRAQSDYLSKLIAQVKKPRYLTVKAQLGLKNFTLMNLTKSQASALIDALRGQNEHHDN